MEDTSNKDHLHTQESHKNIIVETTIYTQRPVR